MIPKKTTKMIVKDGSGNLVQLLPEIETASTIDASSDVPVSNAALAAALEDIEDSLPASALLDVMEEEPTALNTTELDDEALIVWMPPQVPSWSITIDTEATNEGDKMGKIPFCLYGVENASMTVDWGDGTIETYTSANAVQNSCPTHQYASAGEYRIKIESNDFSRLYIWENLYDESSPDIYTETLKCINTPLPPLAGVHGRWYNEDTEEERIGDLDNSFDGCFSGCSSLQSIPEGLFDKNTKVTSFYSCFYNCSSIQSIPAGLFDKNTAVTDFSGCFSGCSSLQSIPSGLFDSNTEVTDFSYCFSYCSSIQSIPSGLFDKNTAVTSFYQCFYSCSSLQSIPSGLFDNNTAVTTFYYCFSGCSSLQSIPSRLFDKNTAVTDFSSCFSDCSSLQSIPAGLFDKNTAVTDFSSCFYGCSSLQSIPAGLFDNNIAVTSFNGCFSYSSIQSIPAGLFDNNIAVTNFGWCFRGCSSLTDFTIHIGSSSVSNCSSFVTNKANTTRTVYVPNNSTTKTKFDAVASSLSLTIIGE